MRRAYHRILGMPQIRPEGLCFRATLKSGRATANPITWPFRSAKQTRSGTTIGLSCFAKWSISALVSGTNPQFRSHAVVQRLDQLHFFLETLQVERAQRDSLALRDDVHSPRD